MVRMVRWRKTRLMLGVILLGWARLGLAHTTGLSTSDLRFGTNGLNAEIVFAGADLMLALAQLESAGPSPLTALPPARAESAPVAERKPGTEKFAVGLERLRKFVEECLAVEFDAHPVRPGPAKLTLDDKDNFRAELNFPGARPAHLRIRAALFAHLPSDHMHFLTVHDLDDRTLGNKMLRPNDAVLEIACPTGEKGGSEERHTHTFTDFLKLGIEHIWTGYDHLLFLLALLLVCRDFKSAVQVVSFFTVAHSITLAFATLNLVWVSSRVVEPSIAASIVYVGVENFVKPEGPKGRWLITFLFGLIHGFGFATILRDMGVAASTTGVAVPLVAFNLGVELGQVVIAGVLLPIIWQLRKWQPFMRWGVPACSAGVAAAGGYWLIQRVFFG